MTKEPATIALPARAASLFVQAALNDLWDQSEEEEVEDEESTCDPGECGQCSALLDLLKANLLDRAASYNGSAAGYAWWDVLTMKVDRDWLRRMWPGVEISN